LKLDIDITLDQKFQTNFMNFFAAFDITHKKSSSPNQKNFVEYRLEDWPIRLSHWTAL